MLQSQEMETNNDDRHGTHIWHRSKNSQRRTFTTFQRTLENKHNNDMTELTGTYIPVLPILRNYHLLASQNLITIAFSSQFGEILHAINYEVSDRNSSVKI